MEMNLHIGEVYLVDLGYEGKLRPVLMVSRFDPNPPRALALGIPITTEYRASNYEVKLPRVPWLREQSYANVQGLAAFKTVYLGRKLGKFDDKVINQVKDVIRWTLEL